MIFQLPRFDADYLGYDATDAERDWLGENDGHPLVAELLDHVNATNRDWWQGELDANWPGEWEVRLVGAGGEWAVPCGTAQDLADVLATVHYDGGEWDHHAGVLWAEVRRIAATGGAGA
jgi:hypothetical protein